MFSWLKSKRDLQLATIREATADLERFLLSLRGMSDDELGTVVAMAALIRVELRQKDLFPDAALGIGFPLPEVEQNTIQANMSRTVFDLQKQGSPCTAGAMIWTHSLRAYRYPEIRVLGRQMWGELARGFPHVFKAFRFMEENVGQPLPLGALQASQFIPVGLEPFAN